jgi:phenylacetate-CoA ligase
VRGAWQYVPLYRAHWGSLAAHLPQMRFPEQLAELPVIGKADLLAHPPSDLIDDRYRGRPLSSEKTSGSSGQPFEVRKDRATVRRRSLRFLRALLKCGYRPGQRLLLISTRRTAGVKRVFRWSYVDLRDEQLFAEYQKARPDVLYGPLSSLLEICSSARRASTALHTPSVVISTAEQLMPSQRRMLEQAFGAPVADFYGMTEVGLVAFRRPAANQYEWASEDVLPEFLPIGGEDGTERLILTDLTGGAMPLIRYDTGDLVRREQAQTGTPIFQFVGRKVDSLRLPSGNAVSPYRVTLRLEQIDRVRQYQVIQRPDLALDVYVHVGSDDVDRVCGEVRSALEEICGDLPMRVHPQAEALQAPRGKFRPVQSEAGVAA